MSAIVPADRRLAHISDFLRRDEIEAVRRPLAEATLVPPRVYSDPAIYGFEVERIFMRNWLAVGRVEQLPEPGSYFTREMFGEPVLVTRDEAGAIHALSNVCRHRSREVAEGAGKCKANRFTCPYHAWSYGLDGRLLSAPFMEQTAQFSKQAIGLPKLGCDIWQGFIFVNFDPAAPKLSTQLKSLDQVLAPYRLGEMSCVDFTRYQANWNWKATLENFSEAYHQPPIHTNTFEPWCPARLARYEDVDGPYNLFWMPTGNGEPFPSPLPAITNMPDAYYREVSVVNVFPTFHLLIDPSMAMWLDWDIRGANDHEIIWRMCVPKETRALPDFERRQAELLTALEPVWVEDEFACNGVARGVRSRFAAQGRLSWMEKSVHQFQNWVLDQYESA